MINPQDFIEVKQMGIDIIKLLTMMFIGGMIGWITNKVAIKMLFRPVKEIKILFFRLQGVLPKRQNEIAKVIGETIETEFLSKEDIVQNLLTEDTIEKGKNQLKIVLAKKIKEIVPSMALMFLGDVDKIISDFIDNEGDNLLNQLTGQFMEGDMLDISRIIEEKVNELAFEEFEDLVYEIMDKELKHIEYVGLFLGLIIGAVQYFVNLLL